MAASLAYIDGVRWCPTYRPVWDALVWGTVAAAGVSLMAGCSAGSDNNAVPSSVSPSRAPASKKVGATFPPGSVGVSSAGVTTRISIPAQSTEEEYFQACHAATVWMQGQQGDRRSLIEPYLATVQAPSSGGAGTWNTAWRELTPTRQAAVIVAAQAAADDGCG
jgi:putative lipoprotein LpqV